MATGKEKLTPADLELFLEAASADAKNNNGIAFGPQVAESLFPEESRSEDLQNYVDHCLSLGLIWADTNYEELELTFEGRTFLGAYIEPSEEDLEY
ncbi:MAG: hypothetical protein ACFCD0_21635 [Gemmataceae bacterium]